MTARGGSARQPARQPRRTSRRSQPTGRTLGRRTVLALAAAGLVIAVGLLAALAIAFQGGSAGASGETVVAARGGHWTNVSPARLAAMLDAKDFTLVNVKTPYIGEIPGTDLYVPYDQLASRRADLPQGRDAKILVYCRSGAESAQAAQTLLDLGYTNVWNLEGGMNAWTASGRPLVNLAR